MCTFLTSTIRFLQSALRSAVASGERWFVEEDRRWGWAWTQDRRVWPAMLAAALGMGLAHAARGGDAVELTGLEPYARLDQLPLRRAALEVGCVSSYDRTGGNDDGFSGKYSKLREEAAGWVLAELTGPGVITRIWTPTPSDDPLEFYFDGEAQPRIRVGFRELFLGTQEPFVAPWVGYGVGGFFSYLPLPYAKSCKVVAPAKRIQFYQINYARYAEGTPVRTYDAAAAERDRAARQSAGQCLSLAGQDLSVRVVPPGTKLKVEARSVRLEPGGTATLFAAKRGGRIAGIRLGPVEALAGKARDLVVRISYDGGPPSVQGPVGDFFGFAWGQPATRSLLIGSTAREAYCYFPMPFDRSAKVELVSERRSGPPVELRSEVIWAEVRRTAEEGRFFTRWRRENPTTAGRPFTFLEAEGEGHAVGFVLQAQGFESGKTLFFEGDDQTWLDGRLAVHGTGSEDFFNGGWYDVPDRWEKRLSFPLSGCLGYQKHLGRTGGYRLLVGDAYGFRTSLKQTIEHAGTENSILTDYVGLTYYYLLAPSGQGAPSLVSASERGVVDLKEIVFPAWWQIPIRAFPFQRGTLTRAMQKFGEEEVRYLSLRAEGQDWFGPPFLFVTCDVPAAGEYDLLMEAVKGPAQGRVQLFADEVPVGEPVDLYAEATAKSGRMLLGQLQLNEGENPVMLKVVSKDERATSFGLDLIHLILVRRE